jgi:hypothetical protein
MVEEDRKGGIQCLVTSTTHDKKSRTLVIVKKGKYFLKHNSLQDVSQQLLHILLHKYIIYKIKNKS